MRLCFRPISNPRAIHLSPTSKQYCLAILRETRDKGLKIRNPRFGTRFTSYLSSRLDALRTFGKDLYPRTRPDEPHKSCRDFIELYKDLLPNTTTTTEDVVLRGRISARRSAGNHLVFVDIIESGQRLQTVCNLNRLRGVDSHDFKTVLKTLQRGDIIRVAGYPHRTSTGELSLLMSSLPQLLSPCLRAWPFVLDHPQARIRDRPVDFIINRRSADLIRAKSEIIQFIRHFLTQDGQIEVQTPVLANTAGGAIARPFQTTATEFPERSLNLRIAPELWLKRMVVGGFDRVFEIGPSFRNEGIDLSHNPEFTTCEFYRAHTDLVGLMRLTEEMMRGLSESIEVVRATKFPDLNTPKIDFRSPFKVLDFIPELEKALQRPLPHLEQPDAAQRVLEILMDKSITPPETSSLSRMLDKLSTVYLEPQCSDPTFIIQHPGCLSPLSKSFAHPIAQGQRVAARAELFVQEKELANMYEEENSPFEQHRKFTEQLERHEKHERSFAEIDKYYLQALEWGLPPVGGWGCGIERLCMVLTGSKRIADVLSFGTLRNVVARS